MTTIPQSSTARGNELVIYRQVAAVSDDREPDRAADDRVSHQEGRRPRSGADGTVSGGLRDVHVGAAAR